MSQTETHDYDPRYDRAQTVDGAKARYIERSSYTLSDLESDIARILLEGEYPDKDRPRFNGAEVFV